MTLATSRDNGKAHIYWPTPESLTLSSLSLIHQISTPHHQLRKETSDVTTLTMVRVVIAGTGAFALILAQQINQTANPLLILSRRVRPPPLQSTALRPYGIPLTSIAGEP